MWLEYDNSCDPSGYWAWRCEDFQDTVTHLLCKYRLFQEKAGRSCKYNVLCFSLWLFSLVYKQTQRYFKENIFVKLFPSSLENFPLTYFLSYQVGFNPLRVLRKRNKALRVIRKLLKKGDLQWTTVRQAMTLSLFLSLVWITQPKKSLTIRKSCFTKQMCLMQRAL